MGTADVLHLSVQFHIWVRLNANTYNLQCSPDEYHLAESFLAI